MTEPDEGKLLARRRKTEGVTPADGVVLPPARFVAPLKTPADVTMERKRLYRAALNGRVSIEESAKLSYMLTGIRTDLEADAPVIDQVTGEPVNYNTEINIISIPEGWVVMPLFGAESHMPRETYHKLKTLLPADAFTPLIESYLPKPVDDAPPFLKVFSGTDNGGEPADDPDPDPPAA